MKTNVILKAISSSGEPYDVLFDLLDNRLAVFCNCSAGIYGKLCKHKIRFLDGDPSMLFDKNDQERLEQVHEMVKKSKYAEIISSYNAIKKEIEKAQKKEKKLKEQIEYVLKTGIEIF